MTRPKARRENTSLQCPECGKWHTHEFVNGKDSSLAYAWLRCAEGAEQLREETIAKGGPRCECGCPVMLLVAEAPPAT